MSASARVAVVFVTGVSFALGALSVPLQTRFGLGTLSARGSCSRSVRCVMHVLELGFDGWPCPMAIPDQAA